MDCVQHLDRKRKADDANDHNTKKVRRDSIRYKLVKKSSTSTLGILSFFDFICQVGKETLLEKLQDREQKSILLEQFTTEQLLLMESVLSELRCDVVRESNDVIAIREGKIRKEPVKSKKWAKKVLSDNRELVMNIFMEFLNSENYC